MAMSDLQTKKRRHRKVKQLALSHTARKWKSQDSCTSNRVAESLSSSFHCAVSWDTGQGNLERCQDLRLPGETRRGRVGLLCAGRCSRVRTGPSAIRLCPTSSPPADAGSPLMPKCGPEGSGPLGWRGLLQGPGLHAMSVPTGGSQGSKGSADRLGRAVI